MRSLSAWADNFILYTLQVRSLSAWADNSVADLDPESTAEIGSRVGVGGRRVEVVRMLGAREVGLSEDDEDSDDDEESSSG